MLFPCLAAQVAGCQRVLHSVLDKMRPALPELKTQFFVFAQHATQFPVQLATKFPTQVIGGEAKPFTRIVQECTPAKVARQCRVYEFHKQAKLTYETRLLYCDFRLKLRAARLLQMRFAIKSCFQQLPNLTIRSLLKIKEDLKTATEIALLFLMRVFSKLAYLLPFSLETSRYALVAKALHCKTAFSATPESEDSLIAEN